MGCNICGDLEKNINIFSLNICKDCLSEIENVKCQDENYDYYKNLIRIFLAHYIKPPLMPNPVN